MKTDMVPFAILPMPLLEKIAPTFLSVGKFLDNNIFPTFELTLRQARFTLSAERYLTYAFVSNTALFFILASFFSILARQAEGLPLSPFLISFGLSGVIYCFLWLQQIGFPQITIKKRIDSIEKNILPALQNFLVQLKSGIPLFDVTVNIASANYGEISKEFMTVVKKVNGGVHQVEAFEKMALENPSPIFRSSIWQIVNGIKTGAELSEVLRDIMINLSEEEVLQIEQYGAVLSPLTMFYMIVAVILPALGINFLIVISAFLDIGKGPTQFIFWGVFCLILFFQVTFMNIIRSRRPSLLN